MSTVRERKIVSTFEYIKNTVLDCFKNLLDSDNISVISLRQINLIGLPLNMVQKIK